MILEIKKTGIKNGVDSVNRLTKKIHEAFVNHVMWRKKKRWRWRTIVTAISTTKGRKLVDNEIVDFNFHSSLPKLEIYIWCGFSSFNQTVRRGILHLHFHSIYYGSWFADSLCCISLVFSLLWRNLIYSYFVQTWN